jgi:hypothetical protein
VSRQTFHKDGATEVRATILTDGKRVDVHIFGDDTAKALGLGYLLSIAAESNTDGGKIEIDADNVKDYNAKK